MANRSEYRKGILFVFLEEALSSFFPVGIVLTLVTLTGLVSLAWSTLFATIFLALVIIFRGTWRGMARLSFLKNVLLAALFIDVVMYGLFYIGLESTTPGNAAIIGLFEVLTSYMFFNVLRGERILYEHKIGAILMGLGAIIVLLPNYSQINQGDVFILIATFFAPIGNFFQLKAKEHAAGEAVIFMRTLFALPVLFLVVAMLGMPSSLADVTPVMLFLVLNGVLILGLARIFWLEGIQRASVTDANSFSCIGPLLTLFFAWLILGQLPSIWQLFALVPFAVGVLLLTNWLKLKTR